MLLYPTRAPQAAGLAVCVTGVSPRVARVLRTTGLGRHLDVDDLRTQGRQPA